jgi:diadenosine tetraphosphatase ApaH/serine/threonine PP2A family protein phosphatase
VRNRRSASYASARAEELGSGPVQVAAQDREDWLVVHPPGYVEYVEALGPEGRYGKWLRSLPAAAQVGDVVFLHGGISPELKGRTVDAINREVADEIAQFDEYRALMLAEGLITPCASAEEMLQAIREEIEHLNSLPTRKVNRKRQDRAVRLESFQESRDWYLVRKDGPIWFAGPGEWDEAAEGATMASLLDAIGARTLVTGQSNGGPPKIEARFDGRVLLTSVGMSDDPWAKREPACLEICDREMTVISPHGREPLVIASAQ